MTLTDYQLDKGAIWEFFYFTKELQKIDPSHEQYLVDEQTREILQDNFNPPPGLSPAEYSQLFMQHFLKTREKSKEIVDENNQKISRYRILSQLGNRECLDELVRIESSLDFHSWENSSLIDYFKQLSNEFL
jgi:hypothetical protein